MMLASPQCSQTRRTQLHVNARQSVGPACFETLEGRRLLSFAPAVNYATVGTPSAIVTADFNNDGKLDLVTCANAFTGSISVFLGNGAGGFGAVQRTVFGSGLRSLAVADFNNDTRPDLLLSDVYNGPSTLIGNGDGTFQAAVPLNLIGGAGKDLEALIRSSHGSTEILVTWFGPDWQIFVQVYAGNLQGGFTGGQYAEYRGYSGMAPVDLNNDGNTDVVTGDGVVFLGGINQSLYFDDSQSYPLTGGAVAIGDFTGDGNADAIVAGFNDIAVLRGRGDGTFDAPITQALAGQHTSVATADFNGDGKLDAVVTTEASGTVSLMLGNGDGTLRDAGAFATGTSPTGVVVGDFNRDGRPDVAVSNAGSSRNVSVLLNDGVWATKTFIGAGGAGGGGNWSTAANWSPSGVPTANDLVTISGKSVNISASATVASLTLSGGASLAVASNGNRVLRTSTLFISANSKLNLNDNDLIVDNGNFSILQALVFQGFNGGDWLGNGITSTAAANDTTFVTALGIASNAALHLTEFAGETGLTGTEILVKYTYVGDANLTGTVNLDDFNQFLFGFNGGETASAPPATWLNGDFNYTGSVNLDDFNQFLFGLQNQRPALLMVSNSETARPDPEPSETSSPEIVPSVKTASRGGIEVKSTGKKIQPSKQNR